MFQMNKQGDRGWNVFFSGFLSWCCSTSVCTHVSVCDPFLLAGRQFPAAVSIEDAEMCQGSAHSTEVQVP